MQELVGRLTALDPEASESLKVIAYFDALVEGHAGLEVLLRGAAVLTGCAAGFTSGPTAMRVDEAGRRAHAQDAGPGAGDARWPAHPLPGGGRVWLERVGAAHANDAMVLERLAIGLSITLDRGSPVAQERRALEILLASDETPDARADAVHRLRLDAVPLVRIAASPAAGSTNDPRSVVLATPAGRVRARVVLPGDVVLDQDASGDPSRRSEPQRVGIGSATAPVDLAASWASALLALRMTSPREPVLSADDLGVVLLAAEAADALDVLDALSRTDSVRAAAALSGVHHSTMQARAADLAEAIGFDPRTPGGRVRLSDALRLHRLATTRFD